MFLNTYWYVKQVITFDGLPLSSKDTIWYDMSNSVFGKDITTFKSKGANVNVTYFADMVYLLSVTLSTLTNV